MQTVDGMDMPLTAPSLMVLVMNARFRSDFYHGIEMMI